MNSSLFESRQKLRVIFCLLLVLASIALYNPIIRAPFLNYDDDYYLILNSHVRAGLTWSTITWAFRATELSNWHPITWLSHALDVQVFGMNPAGHHYVNVLLHALNVALLFLFLERTTGLSWRSLAVAALFAIHPINVESVAWISERKDLLSTLFFLLGLIAYVWYVQKPGVRRYGPLALCFAAGLMAKPQVITFPFVLLLMDYWPLQRMAWRGGQSRTLLPTSYQFSHLFVEKLPLLILSAVSAAITMKVQTTAIHLELPVSIRVANAALAYMRYLGKAFWPVDLAPLYPHPGFSVGKSLATLATIVTIAITGLVIIGRQRRLYLPVGWFWFLGTLVPMIGLVQVGVQAMADRYAYIPFIGLFILVCWGTADALQEWHVPRAMACSAGGVVLMVLAFTCCRQIGYWSDNLALWTHTLEVTRNNFIAEDSAAMALVVEGRTEEANRHFQNAVKINPKDPIGNLNLGVYENQKGNYLAAIAHYDIVLELTTNPRLLATAFAKSGSAYYELKEYEEARRSFEAALRVFPENSQAILGLGLLSQRAGEFAQAADDYTRSVRFQPTDVGYLLLAQALQATGQTEAASAARAQAQRISTDLNRATLVVAQLLAQ